MKIYRASRSLILPLREVALSLDAKLLATACEDGFLGGTWTGTFPRMSLQSPQRHKNYFSGPLIYPSFYEVKNEADDGLAKV